MATLKYFTKGTGNPKTIYIRLTHGRKYDITKSTGLLIESQYWNNNKGLVKAIAENKEKQNLQNTLNDLRKVVLNSFNNDLTKGAVINSEWLKGIINNHFNQSEETDFTFIVDYAKYYRECLPQKIQTNGKRGVTDGTLKKYKTIIKKLEEYEQYKKKRLRLIDIDLKFHKDFIHYLTTKQHLNTNTIGKYLTFIKTIVLDAKDYGLKTNPEIEKRDFRPPKEETTFITLTNEEIETILKKELNAPYLENARDWLIIGVCTGARASDLLNLTSENVTNGFIEYTAKKTGQKIILPLHPYILEILERNDNNFPRKISSQKFNDYIKEVCLACEMTYKVKGAKNQKIKKGVWRKVKGEYEKWELVSTHICRRSFATNHYGKLPTPVIMAITGHKSEKMFRKYIAKTPREFAEELKSYWDNLHHKRERTPKMDVIKTGTDE